MTRIPLRSDSRVMGGLSMLVTGLMVALGILVLAGAAAIRHVDLEWRHALADRWTVELPAADPAHPPAQSEIDQAIAALRTIPGIAEVNPIGPDEMRSLLQPWLRDTALTAELPLPVLIDIRLDPQSPPQPAMLAMLARDLSAKLPSAKLDDHGAWTGDLLRIAQTGEALGLAFFAAVALSMVVTIAATARARLAVNAEEIDLLHTIGATDGYIVRQFQAGALRSAVVGAFSGLIVAGAVLIAFIQNGAAVAPFAAQLRLDRLDLAILACVPAGAILLATFVAGWAARSSVRRLP
jgi:cell division transport system permease protein